MRTFLLARVSTEDQKDSIPAQTNRLTKYVSTKPELEVNDEDIYEFDESAYKTKRVKFDKILDELRNSKEVVAICCDKIDRMVRDFIHNLPVIDDLRRRGIVELHFPSDNIILHKDSPACDLFRFNIGVSLAQYYSDSTRDNVKRGNELKLKKKNGQAKRRSAILTFSKRMVRLKILSLTVTDHF